MNGSMLSRRGLIEGVSALTALWATTSRSSAQVVDKSPVVRSVKGPVASLPPRPELIIRGAHVLTMDPTVGDLASGDVHVRDGVIVAVGPRLQASGAEVIDGQGMICMPGFVDTHWHLWTSIFRPFVRSDVTEVGFFPVTVRLGALMNPEDNYRSVRLGLSQALTAGITTVQNWAHNIRSPEHADAELSAMRDTGIRGRFAYGTPVGAPDEQPMDLADVARVKRDWMPNDGMLTLGVSSRNLGTMSIGGAGSGRGFLTIEQIKKDWDGARALGLPITMHTSGASPIKPLDEAGLLGPNVQLVHPLLTTSDERAILKARGASYSIAPASEVRRPAALGEVQLGELLESGVKVSLSTDHTTANVCDPFGSMRFLFAVHEHRIGAKVPLTMKRLVQLATLDGAVDLGLADRTGSLTVGKRADLILVRTTDPNMSPPGDPYEALVSMGHPSNVDTVIVDGRILLRGSKFTALDRSGVVAEARESAETLRTKANWPM